MDHVPARSKGDRVRIMDTNTARERGVNNLLGTVTGEPGELDDHGTATHWVSLDNGDLICISGAMLAGI